jgi:hypothetical protein
LPLQHISGNTKLSVPSQLQGISKNARFILMAELTNYSALANPAFLEMP